ncbi:MAG: hypothetical protein AW07_01703 [Candidatus Accumulibacter sp. SK-11]|nr:MAG: hypothetical protein AW07_01703 [Candidatus Accumulibacter sp. SK-11]
MLRELRCSLGVRDEGRIGGLLVLAAATAGRGADAGGRLLLPALPRAAAHGPRRASRSGSMRMASRLLDEKQRAAASRHGNQQ